MSLIGLLVAIIVLGLVYYLLSIVVDLLPAPFKIPGKIVLIVIFVLLLLGMLFGQVDMPYFRLR